MGASGQVTVVGRVIRIRRHSGGWRVRLADTGGTLAAAEIRPTARVGLPRVGARIVVYGQIRYDEQHCWHTVDPVDAWTEADD
jgi:hypothetical protein